MLTTLGEHLLELDGASMIGIVDWNRFERAEPPHDCLVVLEAACAEPEFEHDGPAYGDSALGDEGGGNSGGGWFREARKDACVGEIPGSRQLLLPAPSVIDRVEIESAWFAQQRDEFEATLGVDDLKQ